MALKDSLSVVLNESQKNAPELANQNLSNPLFVERDRWKRYYSLLKVEVANEAAISEGVTAGISNAKQIPHERRQLLKALRKWLGHWPTIEDAASQLFVSEVPADVKQYIAEDLKRLSEPVIRRRSPLEVRQERIDKLLKQTGRE